MTPREYAARLDELIRAGRDEDALLLAARVGTRIASLLSAEEFVRISSLLEGAELALSTSTERPSARSGVANADMLAALTDALARGDDEAGDRLLEQALDAKICLDEISTAVARGVSSSDATRTNRSRPA